jgi:transposase-like protein
MEQPITVATFNDQAPAERLVARLLEAGFQADLQDESFEQKWKLFNLTPRAHLRVRVHSSEEERALAQLAEWKDDPLMTEAVHCPECGSSRVEFPQFSRKTIVGALPAALAAARVIDQSYFCDSCQFTWPGQTPAPELELDRLNWPKR